MFLIAPAIVLLAFIAGGVLMRWHDAHQKAQLEARLKLFHDELVDLSRRGPDWSRVHVPLAGRGPNADELYNGVLVHGQGYLFTYENCRDARARSVKYWR